MKVICARAGYRIRRLRIAHKNQTELTQFSYTNIIIVNKYLCISLKYYIYYINAFNAISIL